MPNQEPKHLTPKKRSKQETPRFTWILFALIIMIDAGGTYVAYQTKASLDKTYSVAHGASKTKVSNSKSVSILLMGTDTGALGRTDKGAERIPSWS